MDQNDNKETIGGGSTKTIGIVMLIIGAIMAVAGWWFSFDDSTKLLPILGEFVGGIMFVVGMAMTIFG